MNYNEATPDYCYGCKSLAHRIEESEAQRDEMLEALKEIANMGVPVQKTEHRIARAAIAKALGESNE
jgi:hypothetical protein